MSIHSKPEIDSDDFTELLIKNLARNPEVFRLALQYKLCGDDFVVNDTYGVQIYRHLVDCIMHVGCSPVAADVLLPYVDRKFKDNELVLSQYDEVCELVNYIYTKEELNEKEQKETTKYINDRLKDFLKSRRVAKTIFECKDNPDKLQSNLNAVIIDLTVDDIMTKAADVHPFEKPLFKVHEDLLGTGLRAVDEHINGLGMGEFGIIVGYSGGGKTVFGTNIVFNNAYNAIPAQFISLEENETQISQRFYSKFFEIPYTDLHKGQANQILEHEFVNPAFEERRNVLAKNLSLIGLKGLTPITTDQIYEVMVRKYEKTAFVPKIVVIDQLQFIQAMHTRKSDSTWNEEKQAAMELDELSHKAIGGHHFALWVLHQAKGKLRRHFSRDEIDGFKGIIHKTDLTLGIGRDGINTHEADIFSLKVRHCSDFITTLGADFKYMRFIDRPRQESMAMEGYSTANRNPMSPAANSNALPELPDEIPAPPQMPS